MKGKQTYHFPFAKIPALRTAVLFLGGIVACSFTGGPLMLMPAIFLGVFTIGVITETLLRYKYSDTAYTFAIILYIILLISAGAVRWSIEQYLMESEKAEISQLLLFEGDHLTVKGKVIETGLTGSGNISMIVLIRETVLDENVIWREEYQIQLYAHKEMTADKILPGGNIEGVIRLFPKRERRNPHEFDYNNWLEQKNIFLQGSIERIHHYSNDSEHHLWHRIRSKFFETIGRQYPGDVQPIAKALLTGEKSDLSRDEKTAFSRAGLSHIMAVSGLHVGFIVAPFWILIPYFWKSTPGKWTGLLIFTLSLVLYAGITGFSASVSRASLMALLLTYSRLFHKMSNSFNLMGVAALILMILNPKQVFEVGFQLSFSAVFIILLIMPVVTGIIPEKYRNRTSGKFISIILISAVVQIGLFPVLIYYFGEFSLVGPIANSLVIPLLTIAVPAGTYMLGISALTGLDMQLLTKPVEWIFIWTRYIANYLAQIDLSYISISPENITPLLFFIWILGISCVALIPIAQLRWKVLILFLVSINMFLIVKFFGLLSPSTLKVTLLDVGQGDAIHIETPNEKHVFIDTGRWSPFSNSGDKILLPYLEWAGINHLDAIFLTHPHSDHIGGVSALIKSVKIDSIYRNSYSYSSNLFKDYNRMAINKGIGIRNLKTGDSILLDPSIRMYILSPGVNFNFSNPNNHSLVIKLVYGETSLLFMGDAEAELEKLVVEKYGEWLKSDYLKVGHHGSRTSSTEQFLNYTAPELATVSLSFRNVFGHPHPETIERLYNRNINVEFTSLNGAYVIESDGGHLKRISWK